MVCPVIRHVLPPPVAPLARLTKTALPERKGKAVVPETSVIIPYDRATASHDRWHLGESEMAMDLELLGLRHPHPAVPVSAPAAVQHDPEAPGAAMEVQHAAERGR